MAEQDVREQATAALQARVMTPKPSFRQIAMAAKLSQSLMRTHTNPLADQQALATSNRLPADAVSSTHNVSVSDDRQSTITADPNNTLQAQRTTSRPLNPPGSYASMPRATSHRLLATPEGQPDAVMMLGGVGGQPQVQTSLPIVVPEDSEAFWQAALSLSATTSAVNAAQGSTQGMAKPDAATQGTAATQQVGEQQPPGAAGSGSDDNTLPRMGTAIQESAALNGYNQADTSLSGSDPVTAQLSTENVAHVRAPWLSPSDAKATAATAAAAAAAAAVTAAAATAAAAAMAGDGGNPTPAPAAAPPPTPPAYPGFERTSAPGPGYTKAPLNYAKMTGNHDFASQELRKKLRNSTRFACYCGYRRVDVGRFLKMLFYDVWSPTCAARITWDIIMLLLMLYVVFVTPYIVAFSITTSTLDSPIAIVDIIVNSCFMLDVLLNFRTAYADDDGHLVFNRKHIAIQYLTGWFWVDTLTSLPWDNMFGDQYSAFKAARLLRIVRFVKVFRILRMIRILSVMKARGFAASIEKLLGHHAVRMLAFIAVAFSIVHWAACIFYFVADSYGPDTRTWITNITDQDDPVLTADSSNFDWYCWSLYWSVTTMTTVGYGDITGVTIGEKFVAIATMVLGASVFAYFMGTVATLVAALNNTNVRVTRKKALVAEFLKHRRIPGRLSQKVRSYFEYVLERQLHTDESDLIQELPSSLRMQITWHLHREALEKVPFFQGKHPHFITALVPCLKLEYYSPGDVIVRQGNMGHEMYFLAAGTVEVRLYDEATEASSSSYHADLAAAATRAGASMSTHHTKRSVVDKVLRRKKYLKVQLLDEDLENMPYRRIGVLGPGQYFGEYTCFFGDPRVATVVATSFCELYCLSSHDLEHVVAEWPDLATDLAFLVKDGMSRDLEADALSMREAMGLPLTAHSMVPTEFSPSIHHNHNNYSTYNPVRGQSTPIPGDSQHGNAGYAMVVAGDSQHGVSGGNAVQSHLRGQSLPVGATSQRAGEDSSVAGGGGARVSGVAGPQSGGGGGALGRGSREGGGGGGALGRGSREGTGTASGPLPTQSLLAGAVSASLMQSRAASAAGARDPEGSVRGMRGVRLPAVPSQGNLEAEEGGSPSVVLPPPPSSAGPVDSTAGAPPPGPASMGTTTGPVPLPLVLGDAVGTSHPMAAAAAVPLPPQSQASASAPDNVPSTRPDPHAPPRPAALQPGGRSEASGLRGGGGAGAGDHGGGGRGWQRASDDSDGGECISPYGRRNAPPGLSRAALALHDSAGGGVGGGGGGVASPSRTRPASPPAADQLHAAATARRRRLSACYQSLPLHVPVQQGAVQGHGGGGVVGGDGDEEVEVEPDESGFTGGDAMVAALARRMHE